MTEEFINEFAIVHKNGFTRCEGPFELSHGGTKKAIIIPKDTDDRAVSLLSSDDVGRGAAMVRDGEIVHGGLVEEVWEPEGEGEIHVIVEQYAGDVPV